MTRNRASAKAAGARFERSIADYFAAHVSELIDRRVTTGAKDKGDISGVRHMGGRVVIEAKDYGGRFLAAPWFRDVDWLDDEWDEIRDALGLGDDSRDAS